MKWIGERISFVDDKSRSTIVIEPAHTGWVRGAMGAWVFMWYTIGYAVAYAYFFQNLNQQETIIVFVFAAFWLYYAVRITKSWFWLMWGKELIKIDEVAMTYKRSIRRYGKAMPYFLENITKIRMSHPKDNSIQAAWEKSPWIMGGERLEFDYLGKVVKFGRKLNEKDAQLLFKLITKKIDQQIRTNKRNQSAD
ncbi:hypothetical protein N9089_00055 [Crocinitomicaceae bacterium]|nr:hypothetical protein [Crocinitomicaceae bacterium]